MGRLCRSPVGPAFSRSHLQFGRLVQPGFVLFPQCALLGPGRFCLVDGECPGRHLCLISQLQVYIPFDYLTYPWKIHCKWRFLAGTIIYFQPFSIAMLNKQRVCTQISSRFILSVSTLAASIYIYYNVQYVFAIAIFTIMIYVVSFLSISLLLHSSIILAIVTVFD